MVTATHLVKVSYYVSDKSTHEHMMALIRAQWKAQLGDALENIEVEKL